jgi:DNA-binding FadR family transcriptional regulator
MTHASRTSQSSRAAREGSRPHGWAALGGANGITRRSLPLQVANRIGSQIVSGALPPGALLPSEIELSGELGVSRTALREAIKVLASKGLIEQRPKTGTRIRPRASWNFLDPDVLVWQLANGPLDQHVRNLFDLRQAIEPGVAALAARRASAGCLEQLAQSYRDLEAAGDDDERFTEPDMRFHQGLLAATGNETLRSLGTVIEHALGWSFRLSIGNPDGQRPSLPLHKAVLEAVCGRDPSTARQAMECLLAGAEQDVRRALAARPEPVPHGDEPGRRP